MDGLIEVVGAFVFATLFMTIPILTYMAFIYNWADGLTFLLTMFSVIEFFAIVVTIIIYTAQE